MNFPSTVIHLCSSFKGYAQIRDQPVTASIKYLLKLITLLALVLVASFVPWAITGTNEFVQRFDANRPSFSLHDGRIVTSVPQPFVWGDNNLRFVLDTTGQVTKPDPAALRGVLFMADSFLFWVKSTNATEVAPYSHSQQLSGFPDGLVDGGYLHRLIRASLWASLPISWLVVVLVGTLSCLVQAYLFSVAAAFLERGMPSRMQMNQLLNIAIHAVTPAAILVTVYKVMQLEGLDLWLVYLIAYGVFLIGAANACRDRSPTPESPFDDSM
jgi:hypothetical protein